MKNYQGKIPSTDNGWEFDKTFEAYGIEWLMYIKPQPHSDDWVTCKIVANGKATGKANYWFVFNMSENRVGFSRDLMVMQNTRPVLFSMIIERLHGKL